MYKLPIIIVIAAFSLLFTNFLMAKDKAIASEYPVILEVDYSGTVTGVSLQDSAPEKIKEKAIEAFVGRSIGVKYKNGKAVAYKQKLTISTKHLVDNSKITRR